MLASIVVTAAIIVALGHGLGQRRGPLLRRPYNNRYSDASAAREDHLA
jgi:hypothetical protein